MDDCISIYYSIFILVIFIILTKLFKQKKLVSLGIPISICILYILFISNKSNLNIKDNLEILTDMPNF